MIRLSILTSLLCYAGCGMAQASDLFSENVMAINYDDGSGIECTDGTGKAEHYDLAMFLNDPSLVGKSIAGVRIPFVSSEDISGLKVWLSTSLELSEDEKLPVCDLALASADILEGWTEIAFDEPVMIDGNGVYVGYSFDINRINSNNLKPVCLTSVVSENGYFIHTSRTSKYKSWTNVNEKSNVGSLRMQAMVLGMDANAASVEIYPNINVQYGNIAYVPVRLTCHGYNGVSSIDYDFIINGHAGHGTFTLENPIAPQFNRFSDVEIPLAEITEVGQLPFSVDVVKVNGEDNTDPMKVSDGTLNVFDFVPVHRPLFEEYTGTWCGNCPRGIAAIEAMKELYPDDFICISYHNADAMEITTSFPSEIRGFPDSWISRIKRTDPFFGDMSDGLFHLDEEWEAIKKEPATIAVDIEAEWADKDESAIEVRVKIISQINYSSQDIAIGCALLADDLYGSTPKWFQHNYYAGKSETCAPELKWIADLPSLIIDLHYNDVLILGRNLDGAEANIPCDIDPMTEYEVSFTLPLEQAVSTSGECLVQDKSKLKIVAFGIDRNSAAILNSNQTSLIEPSGINSVSVDSEIAMIEYYNLFGQKTDANAKGMILKIKIFNDGSKECVKIINR